MRLTILKNFKPSNSPLRFTGARGENFQIHVLADDLIRVTMFPDGKPRLKRTWSVVGKDGDVPREGRARDDLSPFPLPAFETQTRDDVVQIRTQQLELNLGLSDCAIRWATRDGKFFASDARGRAYAYDRVGKAIWHYMEHRTDEHYYGFGERAGELDKSKRRMRMLNLDALGYSARTGDALYKHWSFYITFNPETQIAYGLFYDNLASSTFEMGGEIDNYFPPYRYYQVEDGDLDYYLIYGPSIVEVVEKFSALTGRMALPPRWSLGFLGTTMTYFDAPDAQEQLKKFVALCDQHQIPCDVFHLASGYTTDANNKRNVFTWNRNRFPDPNAMVENFAHAGIKLAANIKPAMLTTHPRYKEVAQFDGFVKSAESDAPQISMFWGGDASYLDFTNPKTFDWWKQNVRQQLLEYDILGVWNDNNEYEIWDDDARCDGFGETLPMSLARPLHALLMARASFEAQREFHPNDRLYLLTRSGCPGIQRYAQTWSGDNLSSWETLQYNIPMGLGASLSGMAMTGHDVGGFTGVKPSPELFVRWIQNAILHPRFAMNSWHVDGSVNEPWMYPEVLPIIRTTFEFRYRLMPYLYSLYFEAAHTGHPIIRPLVYEFPRDPRCATESFDFMLGPNLLVASVFEQGAHTRTIYLPSPFKGEGQGEGWFDFWSGAHYRGGETITVDAPLDHIPLFVRAGGMIPMGKAMRYVGEQPDDLRQVFVFPHPIEGRGAFTLIEDDGITLNYQRGEFARVELEASGARDAITLRAHAHGSFILPYRALEFILPPGETRAINARGETWTDSENCKHVMVNVN
ncbi:MAG: glycoside hydrolase family 31 protein [Chloroflexi bacterium]|nr:glycoside hydrolase family 31 protein [Chloroflexota bacterium]